MTHSLTHQEVRALRRQASVHRILGRSLPPILILSFTPYDPARWRRVTPAVAVGLVTTSAQRATLDAFCRAILAGAWIAAVVIVAYWAWPTIPEPDALGLPGLWQVVVNMLRYTVLSLTVVMAAIIVGLRILSSTPRRRG